MRVYCGKPAVGHCISPTMPKPATLVAAGIIDAAMENRKVPGNDVIVIKGIKISLRANRLEFAHDILLSSEVI